MGITKDNTCEMKIISYYMEKPALFFTTKEALKLPIFKKLIEGDSKRIEILSWSY